MKVNPVTSVLTSLNKTPNDESIPQTPTERKQKLLNIVDKAIDGFAENLKNGKVKLNSTSDLERLISLAMMLTGELTLPAAEIVDTKPILSQDDPKVKAIFEQYFSQYNQKNDVD